MMDRETMEVECPVCDHKISVDAVRCPNCNAVFSLSGMDELQKVARELNDPVTTDKPSAPDGDPPLKVGLVAGGHKASENGEPKEKSGLLGKLFKKKK